MANWPPTLPDQTGKVALVTGANTGLGKVTAQELARVGAKVFLACRNQDKAKVAADEIRAVVPDADLILHPLDLSSFADIRHSARAFLDTGEPLHILVSNAGLVAPGLTKDGFELTFGVNHIGTVLFTNLLLDRIKESAPSRIVTVASRAHMRTAGIEFEKVRTPTRSTSAFPEYAQSKLGNVLYSAELGRRLEGTGVTTYSVHPGVVGTDVWRRVPGLGTLLGWIFKSPEEGARTQLMCATDPALEGNTGKYWADERETTPRGRGTDRSLGDELWSQTEEWIASVS